MDLVDYFDSYVKCGLKPLPLIPNTKIPMVRDWQSDWSADKYRNFFIVTSNANMGVLLGDIIDVEGDDQAANDHIFDLARNVPHPMFKSNKSIHHLFVSPDPSITICNVGCIEFRGHRHQSVIPPSIHSSGNTYKWIKGSAFPAPPMPRRMVDFLYENRRAIHHIKPRSNGKKSNHIASICNECKGKIFLHKKRLMLEVRAFAVLNQKWTCQKCRVVDVRDMCRHLKNQSSQDL